MSGSFRLSSTPAALHKKLFFLFTALLLSGQFKAQPRLYDFRYGVGFAIPHRAIMKGLIKEYVQMGELLLLNQGKTQWEKNNRYLKWGVNCMFTTLGNKKVFGNAMGFLPYMEYNNFSRKNLSAHFGLGIGAAYVPKSFNIVENHTNIAVSSNINGAVCFRFTVKASITDYIHWNGGLGFTHFSNGSFKLPNLGINTFTLSTGFTIGHSEKILPQRKAIRDSLKSTNSKKWKPIVFLNSGLKEVYPVLGKKYVVITGSAGVYRWLLARAMVGAQLDAFHDTAIRHHLRSDDQPDNDNQQILQLGISAFLEYKLNRFSFPIQLGGYVYDEYKANGSIYTRLGIRFAIYKNLVASFILKSHYAKADYLETGLGWRW
jgi:hypothetical protein